MFQRPHTLTQAEIDRAVARGRQLRAQAFAAAFARLRAFLAAAFARLAASGAAHRSRPA